MSWRNDGSAELDAAISAVAQSTNEQLADKLDKWASVGVKVGWCDFCEREVLRVAAQRLRAGKEGA